MRIVIVIGLGFVTLYLVFLTLAAPAAQIPDAPENYPVALGISFPPVRDTEQRAFSTEKLSDLGVSHIRFGESWANREPAPGQYNWGPLDARLDWANENGLAVLLTVQFSTPEWACGAVRNEHSCEYANLQDFQDYITALLTRYPNQIAKIQYGNEWQSTYIYTGSAESLVAANNILYETTKQLSPETTVVLGGFSIGALRGLAYCADQVDTIFDDAGITFTTYDRETVCNSAEYVTGLERINTVIEESQYDEVDIHLYADVEHWNTYYNFIDEIVEEPIIVSEFGGPHPVLEPKDSAYEAQQLHAYLTTLAEIGVSEAYFFSLVEKAQAVHTNSGLIDGKTLQSKPSYEVFRSFSRQ